MRQMPIRFYQTIVLVLLFGNLCLGQDITLQPGPDMGKDIWTTSMYSYAPGDSYPGGGKNDYELVVGGWGDSYYSLLQFNLAGMPSNVSSAHLELFCFYQRGDGTTGIYLDRITQFWDWRTQGTGRDRDRLWWNDRPTAVQWIPNVLSAPTVGQWYSIDITDLYNAWQNGTYPNYGIQLRPADYANRWAEFYSSDYSDNPSLRPRLVLTSEAGLTPAQLAKSVVGYNYLLSAKGWDFSERRYVNSEQIQYPKYQYCNSKGCYFGNGLDCSGLVMWAYNKVFGASEFKLGNPIQFENANGQYWSNTTNISESQLLPGDLLFFDYENDRYMDHVAMYVGGPDEKNVVEAASPNSGIKYSKLTEAVSRSSFVGYRRVSTANIGLRVTGYSPIDLIVSDPDGFTIGPDTVEITAQEILTEIPGVLYYSIWEVDDEGRTSPMVIAPTLKTGNYIIRVVPKHDSMPTDSFSLDVEAAGATVPLAVDVPVGSIPVSGYGIKIDGTLINQFVPVSIQVKPGSSLAPINLKARGVLPVAILSTHDFDATTQIDPGSVSLSGAPIAVGPREQEMVSCQDVNNDGLLDLLVMIDNQALKLSSGATQVILRGQTNTGMAIEGTASVHLVPNYQ